MIGSPLAKLIPESIDAEKIKRDGWREHGILVIAVDDPELHWTERELIQKLGDKRYGKRIGD